MSEWTGTGERNTGSSGNSLLEQMEDDLELYFDTNAFAVSATLAGAPISGIFDHEYGEALEIAGERPALHVKTSDASGAVEGSAVVIGEVTYEVVGIQPDGTGVTTLVLEEQ